MSAVRRALVNSSVFLQKNPVFLTATVPKPVTEAYQNNNIQQKCFLAVAATQAHIRNTLPLPQCQWTAVHNRRLASKPDLVHECWRCGTDLDPSEDQYFCECGVVQPPKVNRDYFKVLGLEAKFDIDMSSLKRTYTNLQRHLHPDKFTQKSETEREFSLQQSSIVNKAYSTLAKPLSRGLYLLQLHGLSIDENDIHADPIFLMEIMEINEALAEADSLEAVDEIGETNQEILDELSEKLSMAFKDSNINSAKELLGKLKYYANIDEKVKELRSLYSDEIR